MSKLYFRYGTMDSSKTARLVMDAFEYKQKGEHVLPIKPVLDTRSKSGVIESRVGISTPCLDVESDYDIYNHISNLCERGINLSCILVDEAQFLTTKQVIQLRLIVDTLDIPVMCYGLKSDFKGRLFEGSKALFEVANRFEEVKTTCREVGCKKKAMFNVRYKNGKPTFDGDQVRVGDTKQEDDKGEYYVVKCSTHFFMDCKAYEEERLK